MGNHRKRRPSRREVFVSAGCSDSNSKLPGCYRGGSRDLFYLKRQQVSPLLYAWRELHLVKPIKQKKGQITSLRIVPGWGVGPDSPFALSRESHLRWAAELHGKAGEWGRSGLFQPQASFLFFIWTSVRFSEQDPKPCWVGKGTWHNNWKE